MSISPFSRLAFQRNSGSVGPCIFLANLQLLRKTDGDRMQEGILGFSPLLDVYSICDMYMFQIGINFVFPLICSMPLLLNVFLSFEETFPSWEHQSDKRFCWAWPQLNSTKTRLWWLYKYISPVNNHLGRCPGAKLLVGYKLSFILQMSVNCH